jgi:hypothetical protein
MGDDSTALRVWDQLKNRSSRHQGSAVKALRIIQAERKPIRSGHSSASRGTITKNLLTTSNGQLPLTLSISDNVSPPEAPAKVTADISRKQLLHQLSQEAPTKRKQALLELQVKKLSW